MATKAPLTCFVVTFIVGMPISFEGQPKISSFFGGHAKGKAGA